MSTAPSPVLQFPDLLHGTFMSVARKAKKEGRRCARHYQQHGVVPEPLPLREVRPGDVVFTHSISDLFHHKPAWRLYFFLRIALSDYDDAQGPFDWRQMYAAFEHDHIKTPWGALYHAIEPCAPTSVSCMASRLGALLRDWRALSVPRYQHRQLGPPFTLNELVADIYGPTLEAWCPEGPSSVREHLELTVARMRRATREDCVLAIQRLIHHLLEESTQFKHRETLDDPAFQVERLSELSPEKFDQLSSAYIFSVHEQLMRWDEELDVQ